MDGTREVADAPKSATRRRVLAAASAVAAASIAGCGLLDDGIERSAEPAGIDSDTLDQTRFEHDGTVEMTMAQTVEVAGESRDLRLTNQLATYRKTVPATDGGVASIQLFTTPSVSVRGQEANPFAEFDTQRFLEEMASRAGEDAVDDISQVGTRTVRVLGADRTFTRHEATTERQGQEIVVRIPVARLTHEADILGIYATYPKLLEQTAGVYDAAAGIIHPVDDE
jgi:hypothetical protein